MREQYNLTEISVLKSKLPSATILLCKFHVMKYFKKKISDLNCQKDEKHELAMLVQKLINSQNEEDYNKYHSELTQFNLIKIGIRVKSNGSCTSDRVSELMETIQTIS